MALRQLSKEQAKEEVKKLVDKYNRILESGSIKRYKEEDTKAEFIEPLFEALGWDVRNTENDDEVVREEKISKGRVDYSFRINGIPKFFLEAKALKEDLDNIKFVEQAVNYSWHKGCTWAVLTDFERIKIFNAELKKPNPLQAQFGQTLPCQLFLEKFDQLWLLSRESFEKKILDAEAEKWNKKFKKIPVDRQLLDDLTKFRDLLNKNILKNNSSKSLSGDELDEAVQRIIDRLIFIRTIEDKELEAPMLQSAVREDLNRRVYEKLNLIFRKIDDIYNSKLFTPHLCENLEIDDEVLSKVINGLFNTSDNSVHYDFSAIDADVLGNIYEQYLGHILKKTDKRAKLAEGKAHRKEQGIYYTPTYVVDYIVKNTVGELAKDKKFDLKNIRILDPACGSGSFLMKAFDCLVTLDKKNNGEVERTKLDLTGASATYDRKVDILNNNIFGVDLDPKAVEIAQLNLLLKAAEKKHRLPTLQENVKVGNSLIDDSAIAGNRAFKWEEQFKEIMDNGGFDVVIGNPPYVRQEELLTIKPYLESNYGVYHSMADLFVYFFERELKILKEGGYFGMIVSNKWLKTGYGQKLRKFLSPYWIEQFIDFGDLKVFQDATTYPCIIIIKKVKKQNPKIKYCRVQTLEFDSIDNYTRFNQSLINQNTLNNESWNFKNNDESNILNKIKDSSTPLKEYVKGEVYRGILTGFSEAFIINEDTKIKLIQKDKHSSEIIKPFLMGKEVRKYSVDFQNKYVILTKIGVDIKLYPAILEHLVQYKKQLEKRWDKGEHWYELRACDYYSLFEKPKLIYGVMTTTPRFTLDFEGYYANNANFFIPLVDKSLLAILNSKLGWFLIRNTCTEIQGGYQLIWKYFGNVSITKNKSNLLEKLVDKILSLNKHINKLKNKQTDQKAQLEKEIQKLDNEIDEEVYKLYGITEEEKKIIEESLK